MTRFGHAGKLHCRMLGDTGWHAPTVAAPAELVTIITPVHNGVEYVAETVDSVLSQGYPNLEYIVIDDGSTDDTPRVLERYAERIRRVSHPNMGETHTVNKALVLARGEYVGIVNADDPLRPGAIVALVAALRSHAEAVLAYPDWVEIDPRSSVLKEIRLPQYHLRRMLEEFSVSMGPGVLVRTRALTSVGLRDTSLRYAGDLDLWFRLAMRGAFVHVPELLATHRTHDASASVAQRGSRMADEVARVAHKCFDDPDLPADLRGRRRAILGHAHFVAAHYCGHNRTCRALHSLKSIAYQPQRLLSLRPLRHRLSVILARLPEPVCERLRRILGGDHVPPR
jgi:glycosyltransferase involved in cell wall biosynthesis